mmetsp:Transcript_16554/g.45865  ORF Transcript_16554/g.45865 Transcript_16554/m.45865 type:complete len:267 (-) Transcript_16554:278-1078(-)
MKLAIISIILASIHGSAAFTAPRLAYSSQQSLTRTTVSLNLLDPNHVLESASNFLADVPDKDFIPGTSGEVTYSRASYYTILGLYLTSFPGLWSTVKRSTNAKMKKKTYVTPGENVDDGKSLREQAGEIMAYMKSNNYEVVEAGETITFRGLVQRSLSQAMFLVFCTAIGMASLALVLQIQFQGLVLPVIGEPNWFLLCLIAPYAGIYYWTSGDRVDDCEVKLEANDDDTENSITVLGSEEELERMWRTLEWQEKGMVKVQGLLDA